MSSLASQVLAEAALADSLLATTVVEKPLPLELDLGNMLAIDTNQLDKEQVTSSSYLLSLARDNTQLLLNSIWKLETERVEDAVIAKFPPTTFKLPREKPAPKPKAMTKWEKYAKDKGIDKKKKKDRLVWDDVVSKWVPQFGYKKAQAENDKNWMIPLKKTDDMEENPYEKIAEDKREKKAKNELQRLRNLARTKNVAVPSMGVVPATKNNQARAVTQSDDLKRAADIAKSSTASLGKFQNDLSKKLEKTAKVKGVKRKFESNTAEKDSTSEKERSLGILESITNKSAKLNIEGAVNRQIFKEDQERKTEKEKGRDSKGMMKKGGKGKRSTKARFQNKGGKGKFTGNSKPANRGVKPKQKNKGGQ
eukprot:GFUD01015061.1.p1 GENE.GFUD01015061.1~~GFUD01015061.1.p1  ORF type:complete len:365 (-),score=117.49 GFUD01015061.1:476-1570(-)